MLEEICSALAKATTNGHVAWTDGNHNPLSPYTNPTAVIKVSETLAPKFYQIERAGGDAYTFSIYRNDGILVGKVRSVELADAIALHLHKRVQEAQDELLSLLRFKAY